jgi:hypothetical protein
MSSPAVKHYVVVLKNERVPAEKRGAMKTETRAAYGAQAAEFARDIAAKVDRGDLPGVVEVGEPRSGALPVVFVTATEGGAAILRRDARVQAISAG